MPRGGGSPGVRRDRPPPPPASLASPRQPVPTPRGGLRGEKEKKQRTRTGPERANRDALSRADRRRARGAAGAREPAAPPGAAPRLPRLLRRRIGRRPPGPRRRKRPQLGSRPRPGGQRRAPRASAPRPESVRPCPRSARPPPARSGLSRRRLPPPHFPFPAPPGREGDLEALDFPWESPLRR